jgi:(p)ppGpp synthase/HD superfamily hydrolase
MNAQTNIQLFGQLQRQGYSTEKLFLIQNTYGLAVQLFTGLYRPSGKTFIDHVIGTASILSDLHVCTNLIAAALVHAAYEHGDFGEGKKGISASKRDSVRKALGKEVEEYVARYTALRWNGRTIPAIYDGFDELGSMDRDVLLIRLANELDDLSDLGILYCFKAEAKRYHHVQFGPMLVEMATKLGFPHLAAELMRTLAETASAEIVSELGSRAPGVTLMAPRSYWRRPTVVFRQEVSRARKLVGRFIRRTPRLGLTIRLKT